MELNEYHISNFSTQNGSTLDVTLAYATYGQLNTSKNNAILVLTSYSATHEDAQDLFAKTDLLDLSSECVIVINMLCNSASSSPSNTPAPFDGPRFPLITVHDNVKAQHELITQELGIKRLRLVMGFSMGGLQTFEWGAQHAGMIDAILPICGAARVSNHNWLFLEGAKKSLLADPAFDKGDYSSRPEAGMEAFSTVYGGWVFSQDFFREELFKNLGMEKTEDVINFMKDYFYRREANDLLGMLETWQTADISANPKFEGDFSSALEAITARAIIMPCKTDLYFRVADSEFEVSRMPNAELRIIDSSLGHIAGGGMDPIGKTAIDLAVVELLK